jgi:hypothetical protein
MRRRARQVPLTHANAPAPGSARKAAGTPARASADSQAPLQAGAKAAAAEVLSEEVLCIIRNTLSENLSLRVCASSPGGISFLQGMDADLEPGGHLAFVGAIRDNVVVGTEFGVFRLQANRGRPCLEPSEGWRQTAQRNTGAGGVPPWLLSCQLVSSSQSSRASVSEHEDLPSLFASEPALSRFRVAWAAHPLNVPSESTVLALEDDAIQGEIADLLSQHGPGRFLVDGAVFFNSEQPATIQAKDGTLLNVRAEGASIVVEIPARDNWPAMMLSGDRAPVRVAQRWQLCYRLQRLI